MTLTLWKLTEEVAAFEDDHQIGWDTRRTGYTFTKGDDDAADLHQSVVDQNDCEVRVTLEKMMEVPTYDVPEIIRVLSLALPTQGVDSKPKRTAVL